MDRRSGGGEGVERDVERVLGEGGVEAAAEHVHREALGERDAGVAAPVAHVAQDASDVDVVLERPTALALPGGTVTVSRVRLSVDDVDAFLDAVRTRIP